ncbi:MAG: ABC transporter ATP-binding protein [bacterium]|nr:ABC transporter ATP-binding protein [bacterium]
MNPRFKKFVSYYCPYLGWFAADMVCALIVSATTLALPLVARIITGDLLDTTNPDALQQVYQMGAVMLMLVLIQTASNTFVDYQGHMMGAKMERDMRNDLFDHYQKLSYSFYDDHRTGQLMSRLTNDLFAISELYHHAPEDLAIAVLKFTGAFIILFTIDVSLALIVFLFLPVMALYAFYFNRQLNAALLSSKERIGDVTAQVEDTLAGIRVVKSFANEDIERRKFAHENDRFVNSRREGYRGEAYFYSGMMTFTQLLTIAVIVFGAAGVLNRSLSLPDVLIFVLCVGILIEPIQRAVNIARLIQEGVTGFSRFMEIMEIAPEIQDSPDAVALKDVEGSIEFRGVSFRYRDNHQWVLRDVSLSIRAGEYVALVGASGVGKSTLCSLIPRFYEVTEGDILIDGISIRDVTQQSLRQQIGVVQQDVYLFAGTVAENIAYGRPGASREAIIEAAKQANAHDFIMGLPNGYDTDIGQRGVKLSGGQKQRLSIARVFLKNPPILIFDEATSSLDNESERAVQEALEALAHNRTTIVIAHRLSTVRKAERIIVLTDNGIAEQGTHEALMALGGTYAMLYNVHLEISAER